MGKIYAKQVPPEYQESPLYLDDFFPDNIILDGNRHYKSHTTPLYDRIIASYDEAAQYLDELKIYGKNAAYKNVTEIINDFFPAQEYREKPYTTRNIHTIRRALDLYGSRDYFNGEYIIQMLNAITGRVWRSGTIRGCCQSDWQDIIYPVDEWSAAALETFETEYFNTGTEWIVHDEENAPETPEEISGFSIYCTEWREDDIRAAIADAAGGKPEDVVLYEFTGWSRSANWEVK